MENQRERNHELRRYTGTKVILIKTMWVAALCFLFSSESRAQPGDSTVRAFIGAFNKHDVEGMLSLAAGDVTWFNVMGDSMTHEVTGREAFGEWLTAYFKSIPSIRSEVEGILSSGSYVVIRERVIWIGKESERTQTSIGVYEVFDRRIRRAWYFPAEKLSIK